ncbi:MAG: 3'-5' exonuclease, partial [Burkholderiaceae bacterium]
ENPNDDTSFLRVVNFPTRGIGARTLEQLQDAARRGDGRDRADSAGHPQGIDVTAGHTSGAGGATARSLSQSVGAVPGKGGANLQAFVALIDAMRDATHGLTLREIIEFMLHASGLVDFYKADREGKDRLENLAELVNAAEAFVTQEGFGKDAVALPVDEHASGRIGAAYVDHGGVPGAAERADLPDAWSGRVGDTETGEIMSPLAAFLTHASLEAGDNQARTGQDAVQLMTVHSAKGLEFDCVFITGLEEGLFPHENSASDPDGLEEERRLMYVAITRARKRLYLSFSQTRMLHGQTRYNVKSRFFDELPEAALKWITPRNQGFGSGFAREYQTAWSRGSGLGSMVGAGRVEPRASAPALVPKAPSHGLRSGQSVFHTKFGEGVILTLEGSGDDARAQVNFGRHGMKWLALSIAKLTPVN